MEKENPFAPLTATTAPGLTSLDINTFLGIKPAPVYNYIPEELCNTSKMMSYDSAMAYTAQYQSTPVPIVCMDMYHPVEICNIIFYKLSINGKTIYYRNKYGRYLDPAKYEHDEFESFFFIKEEDFKQATIKARLGQRKK